MASIRFLQQRWRYRENRRGRLLTPSHQRISGFLRELERHKMVSLDKRNEGTIITICNYDKYQSKPVELSEEEREANDGDNRAVYDVMTPQREMTPKELELRETCLRIREESLKESALKSEEFMREAVQFLSVDEGFVAKALHRFMQISSCIGAFHFDDNQFRSCFYKWCRVNEEQQTPPFEAGWRERRR